jgi:uncharacterized protein YbjT (DUF2867 family)
VQGQENVADSASERIFLTGGTGFVGRYVQRALAGRKLRLLVRDRAQYAHLATPDVEIVEGDVTDRESLRGALDGCSVVIHLVAIIEERRGLTFDRVIRGGTENVVAEAQQIGGIRRFLQMSAIGATNNPHFPYFQAKWAAEEAVRASGIPWTIFRPSVIFGPGDGFITVLANLVRKAPVIPVVGSGRAKFMPVAVEEVAAAFARAIDDPATVGEVYELGGGTIYTYEELLDLIAEKLGKKKRKVHIPVGMMMPIVKVSQPLPKSLRPPVTVEQLRMLAIDNTTNQNATGRLVGHPPTSLSDALDYIAPGR